MSELKADFSNTGQLVPDALGQARQYFEHGHWMSESHDEYDVHEFAALAQAAALIAIAERLDAQNEHLSVIRDHLDDAGSGLLKIAGILDATDFS